MKQQTITSREILAQAIKAARQKKGITQSELGKLIGIKQTTVSAAENGSPGVKLDTLFRILSGLDLSISLQMRKTGKNRGEW